jgi:hypothetical protein
MNLAKASAWAFSSERRRIPVKSASNSRYSWYEICLSGKQIVFIRHTRLAFEKLNYASQHANQSLSQRIQFTSFKNNRLLLEVNL